MHQYRLAEEFFLLGHDEFNGKPVINRELVGFGVVAAMICEQILEHRLGMLDGLVTVRDRRPTGEPVGDRLVAAVAAQPTAHSVRTWGENLGEEAYQLIAERLVGRGTLEHERGRRLLGGQVERFPAANLYQACRPRMWLAHVLVHPEDLDLQRAVSAALIGAIGTEQVMSGELGRQRVRQVIASFTDRLSDDLKQAVAGLRTAVEAGSLTIRR
jgi:hypothetical protein